MWNRWVTLFPPCCLPGINIYPCCWKAYCPLTLLPLVKWLCRNVNLLQEENTGRKRFTSYSTPVNLTQAMYAGGAMRGQDIYLIRVIIAVSIIIIICYVRIRLFSTGGRVHVHHHAYTCIYHMCPFPLGLQVIRDVSRRWRNGTYFDCSNTSPLAEKIITQYYHIIS